MKYNQNQELAIFTKDKDILVSAGAGSGKTFVMIERIAENIIKHNVSVDELLVVTFTNAAANEMRLKLNDKLLELLNDDNLDSNERKYLLNQVDLMGQSDICTLHKFCQTLIQKYFYTIEIYNNFCCKAQICQCAAAQLSPPAHAARSRFRADAPRCARLFEFI